jgi:hypothetical protein
VHDFYVLGYTLEIKNMKFLNIQFNSETFDFLKREAVRLNKSVPAVLKIIIREYRNIPKNNKDFNNNDQASCIK